MRPSGAIVAGALLSLAVEFTQQWIPGRDPSVGDIVCNTASTAIGVALVRYAPVWLLTPPRRSAWQALATAVLALLVWAGTGAAVRQLFPPPPYHEVRAPDFNYWGQYRGEILWTKFSLGALAAGAIYPSRPPGRSSPLVAVLDTHDTKVFVLAVDGHDLSLRYHMPAVPLTLEQVDLRWRGALADFAPGDSFSAATWSNGKKICLGVNDRTRCGYGYTVGDGWKLIFYPERWSGAALTLINALWIAGCVIGVGFWAARGTATAVEGGNRRYETVLVRSAIGISLLGLIFVPWMVGLKGTTLWEWIGALGGIELGLVLGNLKATGSARSETPPR